MGGDNIRLGVTLIGGGGDREIFGTPAFLLIIGNLYLNGLKSSGTIVISS